MNPIDIKTRIESVLGVTRNNNGQPTNYGLLGKYTYASGFQNVAFAIGRTPQVNKVEGLEAVLLYPDTKESFPICAGDIYSDKCYRLALVEHSGLQGHNAILMLERSGILQGLNIVYIPANPEVGNFPQWNLKFKVYEFRTRL
jgi:hypothetical protein